MAARHVLKRLALVNRKQVDALGQGGLHVARERGYPLVILRPGALVEVQQQHVAAGREVGDGGRHFELYVEVLQQARQLLGELERAGVVWAGVESKPLSSAEPLPGEANALSASAGRVSLYVGWLS